MNQTISMWHLTGGSGWEFIARGAIVYFALLLLMRLGGKRQIGQMSPFDLVLLLLVSNAVQNSMNAGDNSVTAGLILATTLVAVNFLVGMAVAKNKKIAAFVEGQPQLLIHNGKVCVKALKGAEMSMRDLEAALRLHGVSLDNVHYAILETNGQMSFNTKDEYAHTYRQRTPPDRQPVSREISPLPVGVPQRKSKSSRKHRP